MFSGFDPNCVAAAAAAAATAAAVVAVAAAALLQLQGFSARCLLWLLRVSVRAVTVC